MPFRDPLLLFHDISENIQQIEAFVSEMDLRSFSEDIRTVAAVERNLQKISEAAARLGDDAEELCPGSPWRSILGIGNWLRHQYDKVDVETVWNTVRNDLPELRASVEKVIHSDFAEGIFIASGLLGAILPQLKAAFERDEDTTFVVFEKMTDRKVKVDLRGVLKESCERAILSAPTELDSSKPPVALRKVLLLPRHWAWLEGESSDPSVVLRRLVDQAIIRNSEQHREQLAPKTVQTLMPSPAPVPPSPVAPKKYQRIKMGSRINGILPGTVRILGGGQLRLARDMYVSGYFELRFNSSRNLIFIIPKETASETTLKAWHSNERATFGLVAIKKLIKSAGLSIRDIEGTYEARCMRKGPGFYIDLRRRISN